MRSTFSRIFVSAALILLAALLAVGVSFQFLVRNYLTNQAVKDLQEDADQLCALATAYCAQDGLRSENMMVNLSIAAQVSGSDSVICNRNGTILLCSDSPFGCSHQGMTIQDQEYLDLLLENGGSDTGKMQGLYEDTRYMVAQPFHDARETAPVLWSSLPPPRARKPHYPGSPVCF